MKNYSAHTFPIKIITPLAFVLLTAGLTHATNRDEAQKVLFVLQQTGVAETAPDEMHSVDASFSEAEHYFQQKNREMSDRYYLLTIQKARVLLAKVLDRISDTPATETQQTPNTRLASIPSVLSDAMPSPGKP